MSKRLFKGIGIGLIIISVLVATIPFDRANAVVLDEFQMDEDTLVKYAGTATTVSVSDNVKHIGEEAFADNQTVGVIDVGRNLTSIEHGAFANAPYVGSVTTHDSLKKIDTAAFAGCKNLYEINFGGSLEELGYGVFAGCNNLGKINISRNNTHFKMVGGGLYDMSGKTLYGYLGGYKGTYYKMPDSVENINKYAFWGNEKLDSISISPYVDTISSYAFSNCKNLKFVNIPYSVNTIDAKAFENCISLADIEIPASVTYIDPTAFDGCGKLNIIADEGTVAYDFFKNFDKSDVAKRERADAKTVIIPRDEETTSRNQTGASEGPATTEVEPGDGLDYQESPTVISNTANLRDASLDPSNVEYMPKVDPLSIAEDSSVVAKTVVVGGNAVLFFNPSQTITEGNINSPAQNGGDTAVASDEDTIVYDSEKGGYLPKYTEVGSKIAMQAYYAAKDLDDYVIPNGITSIGDFAYARSNLQYIDIPSGVTRIGYGAFYHCDNLGDVNIPSTVTDIDAHAFDNTPYMNNFQSNVSGNDFLIVGDGILLAYSGNSQTVNVPEGVKKIAPGVFTGHSEIINLALPNSLDTIGDDAFRGCSNLTSVVGGANVKEIGDRAYMNCPITTMTISPSVEKMGLRAIDYTETGKDDATKVVVFEGTTLPMITAGSESMRLENETYRNDALYNVLFAVVDDSIDAFDRTVLDKNMLGFSGLVLSKERDDAGNETGNMNIKANYIYSEDVLANIPSSVTITGTTYNINGVDTLTVSEDTRAHSESSPNVSVVYNGVQRDDVTAIFSENENVGTLYINESDTVSESLKSAYSELFGESNTPSIKGYDITLKDATDTALINKFGQASLSVTMPIPDNCTDGTYHVITLDDDGQLEEVETMVDEANHTISFTTNHLSYYGIYSTDSSNGRSILKSGRTVKNYRKDASPDTGDYSIPIKYVIAVLILCSGLFMLIYRKPQKV